MKVAILNTSVTDGGAARAARRLAEALTGIGHSVTFVCDGLDDRSASAERAQSAVSRQVTRGRRILDAVVRRAIRRTRNGTMISLPVAGASTAWLRQATRDCDVVHLHWVNHAFVRPSQIARLGKPVVWTLHDMWPFTGACHYSDGCEEYLRACRGCPQVRDLGSGLVRAGWRAKQQAIRTLDLRVVAPSAWMTRQARRSALLAGVPATTIPNPLDLATYRPINKRSCREKLGLPLDRKIILFGAVGATADRRKGFEPLRAAVERLAAKGYADSAALLVFGDEGASPGWSATASGLPIHFAGFVSADRDLATLYNAADVFVLPSLEENLANTLAESQACGVPAVAFDIGGNSDLVVPNETGLLGPAHDVDALARNIERILCETVDVAAMAERARSRAERLLDPATVAHQYLEVYNTLVGARTQDARHEPMLQVAVS